MKKNNITGHLTIRLGIPALILFLIWKIVDHNNGSLEDWLIYSLFASFFIFIINITIISETIIFHRNKKKILRNINFGLLVFYIPFFVFMTIISYGIANY